MKRFFGFAMMLALLSVPALAGKNSQTVNVPVAVKAGSTQLTPGNYDVTWTGSGPSVQVTFARNRKVLVTLPAKLVETSNKEAGLNIGSVDGVEILQAIRLKNVNLVLSSPLSEK